MIRFLQQLLIKFSSTFILIASLTLLSGCTVKLAYHFLDWGLQYKLNHYLALNSEQSKQAKKAIKEFHHWHQRNELPRYSEFLIHLRSRLAGPQLTAEDIGNYRETIKRFGEQSLDHLLPELTNLLKSLNGTQKQQFFSTLDKDQKDYEGLYLKPPIDEIREVLKSDVTKSVKKYMGKLSDAQKLRIEQWSHSIQPFGAAASAEQNKWEALMNQLLEQPQRVDYLSRLKELMMYDLSSWDSANRAVVEHNQAATYQLISDLLNSRSQQQNTALIEKLNTYITDCEDLIAQATEEDKNSTSNPRNAN
jgi:hypothetical protein